MLRIHLTPTQRQAVRALRHDPTMRPAGRDRVELLLLADAGWTPQQLAAHFQCCVTTVRRLVHRFESEGLPALRRQRPGPPPDTTRRAQVTTTLAALLAQDRTWTAGQLADALAADGLRLGPRQVSRYLHHMAARYLRTVRTLQHKQDPLRFAHAQEELAGLKKGRKQAS